MRLISPIFHLPAVLLFFVVSFASCERNNGGDCDDDSDGFELEYTVDPARKGITIEVRDPDSDSDRWCDGYDLIMNVSALNGARNSGEIAFAIKNNSVFSQRIAITEEGVKQYSSNLADLDDFDDVGNDMIYVSFVLLLPSGMTPEEYRASSDFNPDHFKMFYFGVYEGGGSPDATACENCEGGICPDGSLMDCGCFRGWCYCTICIDDIIF